MAGVSTPSDRQVCARSDLAAYFSLAFAISWSCWIAAALLAGHHGRTLDVALLYAGIPGPLLAALWLLYRRGSPAERAGFLRRIYQVERLRPAWLLAVLLLYPGLTAMAVGLDRVTGGTLPDSALLARWLGHPSELLSQLVLLILLGPLPEEPGWRGYALDRLLVLRGALGASLVLGVLWALWHLPLFFIPGTYQQAIGLGSPAFWLFMLTAVCASVLMTWVYRHSAGSIFGAILFHAALNITRAGLPLADRAELVRTGLLLMVTVLVVWRCGPRGLDACR